LSTKFALMRAKTSIGSKLRNFYEYPIGRSIVKLRPTVLVNKDDTLGQGENSLIKAISNLSLGVETETNSRVRNTRARSPGGHCTLSSSLGGGR